MGVRLNSTSRKPRETQLTRCSRKGCVVLGSRSLEVSGLGDLSRSYLESRRSSMFASPTQSYEVAAHFKLALLLVIVSAVGCATPAKITLIALRSASVPTLPSTDLQRFQLLILIRLEFFPRLDSGAWPPGGSTASSTCQEETGFSEMS